MMPLSETEIRGSMVNLTPEEAQRIPIPGLHEALWEDREYLGWRDASSSRRGYIVFWRDDEPVGFSLRAAESRGRGGTALCSLCSTQQPAGQVTMFTASRAGEAGRLGHSVGTYICSDLACSLLIRVAPPAHEWQPDPSVVVQARSEKLAQRLLSFSERVLDSAT